MVTLVWLCLFSVCLFLCALIDWATLSGVRLLVLTTDGCTFHMLDNVVITWC